MYSILVGTAFANDPGDRFSARSSHIKDKKKRYLMPHCLKLRIIRYRSRVE